MAAIGNLYIGMSTGIGKFAKDMDRAASKVGQLGNAVASAGGKFAALGAALVVGAGVAGVTKFFSVAIEQSAALGESVSKLNAILGDGAPLAEAYASGLASRFGLVKKELIDAQSSLGGLAKGLGGLSGKALVDFSNQFAGIAADFQSYADSATLAEAAQALTIALSGDQSDALKRVGVVVNETTTKQYAYAHGIAKVGEALTEQQKFMARAALITIGLKDAIGDLERTGGGTRNQMRKLSGAITNLTTDFGDAIEPITRSILSLANKAFGALIDKIAANGDAIKEWASSAARPGGPIEKGFLMIGEAVAFVANGISIVRAVFKVFVGVVTGGMAAILKPFGLFSNVLGAMADDLAKSSLESLEAFNAILNVDAGAGVNKFFKDIVKGANKAGEAITNLTKEMSDLLGKTIGPALGKALGFGAESGTGLGAGLGDVLGTAVASGAKGAAKQIEANKKVFEDMQSRAKSIMESTMSPLEQHITKLEEIQDLQAKGFLTQKAAEAAAMKMWKEGGVEPGGEARGPRLAGALELGSKEEYSLRVNAGQRKGDDQKNTAKNTMETVKGIREQIGILKQLNTKLTGAPPLVQFAI